MNISDFRKVVLSNQTIILDSPMLNAIAAGDDFGFSVAMNATGTVCIIGAPNFDTNNIGRAVVYAFNATAKLWEQRGDPFLGALSGQKLGYSVAINGDGTRIVIGSPGNSNVQVYSWNGTSYTVIRNSTETATAAGWSVAINSAGNRIAVGAPTNSATGTDRGAVEILDYSGSGTTWNSHGIIAYGEANGDKSGWCVSLNSSGNRVAIGAPFNDIGGTITQAGHTRVYHNTSGTSWIKLGIDLDGSSINEQSGFNISLNDVGDIVAIGNIQDDTSANNDAGTTRVYKWSGGAGTSGSWSQQGLDLNGNPGDLLGYSVSLNSEGNILAIGAPFRDNASGIDSGGAQVYEFDNTNVIWKQIRPLLQGQSVGEQSGLSVSLSKNSKKIIVGAPYTSTGGTARIYSI